MNRMHFFIFKQTARSVVDSYSVADDFYYKTLLLEPTKTAEGEAAQFLTNFKKSGKNFLKVFKVNETSEHLDKQFLWLLKTNLFNFPTQTASAESLGNIYVAFFYLISTPDTKDFQHIESGANRIITKLKQFFEN